LIFIENIRIQCSKLNTIGIFKSVEGKEENENILPRRKASLFYIIQINKTLSCSISSGTFLFVPLLLVKNGGRRLIDAGPMNFVGGWCRRILWRNQNIFSLLA
jgi:hypothetical protein